MKLKEWAKHYIKFKDCMRRQIKNIEEKENKLIVEEKKETKTYFICEKIDEALLKQEKNKKYIITLNTKSNIKQLEENWKLVEKEKNLTIIFTNPKTNENWTIHPFSHAKISDEKTIKQGLRTLYESIKSY